MKKNPFVQGAMIATIGIIVSKILGIIYVIPFYAIIGEKGGALYGYAYSIYSIFLALSTIGIPLAISKLTSEYNTLGDYHLKERAYKIAKRVLMILSFISFVILMIFAPSIAHIFIGDIQGGNTIEDVAFVIRMVSTAILVVPALSVTRGYLQGHKYITPPSISQVIEQLVRILVVLIGSYACVIIFDLSLKIAVGVAVLGATVGAMMAYLYLLGKIYNHRSELRHDNEVTRKEVKITNKEIVKRLIIYAIPFVLSSLVSATLYNFVDLATVVKTMVNGLNYTIKEAESVISIMSTWTSKLNMIVISVGMGLTTSLLPNITDSFMKKDKAEINHKINKSLQLLLCITIPLTMGIILLATPLWTFFFGHNELGVFIFRYTMVVALLTTLLQTLVVIFQSTNDSKKLIIFLLVGLVVKIVFTVPLMHSFASFGIHASYGAITATVLGYVVSCVMFLSSLKRKLNVNYEPTFKKLIDIIFATLLMSIVILLLQFVIPVTTNNRLLALLLTIFYGIIGSAVYFFITIRSGMLSQIFGESLINKVLTVLHLKKKKAE